VDILLVMNPQNSFFSHKGAVYMGEKAEILKIRLDDFLKSFSKTKIFLREAHAMEDDFFTTDKTHSITNSDDFKIHNALKKHADIVENKIRYSALFKTAILEELVNKKVKHVGLVGVETHTSILFTAEELRNRNYEVTVVEPCTMARDDYMHSYAITLMRHSLGVRITDG